MDAVRSDQDADAAIPVRLFRVHLPDVASPDDRRILSPAERDRADRFVSPTVAARFVHMRATLRRLLCEFEQCAPDALDFVNGPNGKPALASGGVHFNVSHSHCVGVIAVCADAPVGVDVERVQPVESELIEPFLAAPERAALTRLAGPERLAGLYRCWCRKEAYVKALGVGLSLPLDSFVVSVEAFPALLVASEGPASAWRIAAPHIGTGYEAALAVRTEGRALQVCVDGESADRLSRSSDGRSLPAAG